ncbi:efflux RND transporter permease subunit [Alistipes sp.]|uniref:efflux RND transporter permease subunit n=1 Tax=Alistipes sp. TaxID=1872444 RepID=UPI0011C7B41B
MEKFFVNRPIFAIALAVAIVLLGGISILNLSIEQYPDITPPVVQVSASYEGADAETVNNAVATPVAQHVMGVSDMLYMQSTSANDGSMTLEVTFDIGSDPDLDAIFTQNNVTTAAPLLPASVTKQGVVTRKSNTGFLMVYAIYSDGRYDNEFLANYAYINLQNRLLKINGVGKVSVMGSGEYAMRIWVRPDVLRYYNISMEEISSAIEMQGGIYPAGQFGAEPAPDGTTYTYTVTMPAQISTADQFADIVIRTTSSGEQIRIRDVADVTLGSQSYGVSSLFGGKPAALIVLYQEPGSNAVDVGRKIKAEMQAAAERLPDGIAYTTVVDTTTSIKAGIKDIFVTLIIALVLVILIIYLFIQDWRATLIPLVAIPVSLIGAFILFPLLGFSINIISLLGLVLAIGLVVDDAIVVVEAAQVNVAAGMTPKQAAIEAMRSVAPPIVATTVVLLAVFVPVSFTGGITGLLFRQFSITIAVSVVISAFNALSLSPALCALLLRRRDEPRRGFFAAFNRWFNRRMERYSSFTATVMKHTARTAIFIGVLLVAIFFVWRALPAGFLPEEDQGFVMVMVSTPEASSLQVTTETLREVDAVVSRLPEVQSTSLAAGFNMMAGIASTDSGIIFATLTPYKDRKLSAMQIAQQLTEELYMAVPGAQCYAFIPPSIPGLGVSSGISVQVQDLEGKGTSYLAENAFRLIDSLHGKPGVASVTTQFNDGVPQRRLVIDKEQALSQGVSLGELYNELTTLLGGAYINNFNRFGKLYQTYVQAAPDYRRDARSLDSYFITNSSGDNVPLSSFLSVKDTVGVEYVSQFNLYRSIELTVTTDAKASTSQVMKEIASTASRVLPDDVAIAWSGISYQESNASKTGPLVYVLALAFVFLSLAALYESWGLPLAILLSVPLAVLGALAFVGLAHLIDPLFVNNIYMQISLVMLIGLAAKNAILVVEYADRLFFEQGKSLLDAAVGAARLRVRPILMTAFAFILGVLPLVFASGVYATARNIMGVALVGGMLLATLLGIFVYPALYYLIARAGRFDRRRERMRREQAEAEAQSKPARKSVRKPKPRNA